VAAKVKPAKSPFGPILIVIGIVGVAAIGYVVSRPTKIMTLDPTLPALAAAGIVKGSPDAPIEVIEFADFECPGCAYFATLTEPDVMNRLVATGQVRFRFMDFPLPDIHRSAVSAHNAAHCANEQGKFWEYHDMLFQTQDRWNGQATLKPRGPLKEVAQTVGLDVGKWEECYDSERMLPQILGNRREGERRRVGGTPTFIIGTQMFSNPGVSFDEIKKMIDEELAKMAAASAPAGKAPAAPKTP
jgi:protein-disulfide isomerase